MNVTNLISTADEPFFGYSTDVPLGRCGYWAGILHLMHFLLGFSQMEIFLKMKYCSVAVDLVLQQQ